MAIGTLIGGIGGIHSELMETQRRTDAIKLSTALAGLTVETIASGLETVTTDLWNCDRSAYERVKECQLIVDSISSYIGEKE